MAADKEVMKALETLRLDRPGRLLSAMAGELANGADGLAAALRGLAETYREEAALWERSGAKGWKSSAADAALIAQAVDSVAAQLDNAGGGAALSVSERPSIEGVAAHAYEVGPGGIGVVCAAMVERDGAGDQCGLPYSSIVHAGAGVDAEISAAAERVAAVRDLAGLDALIADSVAQRRGHVRDNANAEDAARAMVVHEVVPMAEAAATRILREMTAADATVAYLKGDIGDIPGTPPLAPGSVRDATAPAIVGIADTSGLTDDQRAKLDGLAPATLAASVHPDGWLGTLPGEAAPDTVPPTWETETMTADGLRMPGAPTSPAPAGAPLLGQPGDGGSGYSHAYVPPGGRKLSFADLLQPVAATALPAHLSNSQIGDVGDCAAKYRLQRVDLLPQVPQWANVGGSAFHAAVEAFERTVAKMAVGPAVAAQANKWAGYDVETVWKHHFEAEIDRVRETSPVPVSMWRASRKGAEGRQWWEVNGPQMLRRYLDARPDELTASLPRPDLDGCPIEPAIEREIRVDVPTPYGPLPFVAKLDRVTVHEDQQVTALIIRDYKTSYERPTDTTQLGDYANALRLAGVPEHVAILGSYFDARRGEWTTPVDLLQAHPFEAFQYRVTSAHAQKRALTTGPTPARPSSFCGGCAVRYACPIMAAKS
jgi:hypothetical protein